MTRQEGVREPFGLRERNKARRREAIVASTIELLREWPLAEVSVERIAADAEVSTATVYNLVGTKEQILHACVDRVLDHVVDALVAIDPEADPLAAATAIVEQSAEAFIADEHAYRQIVRALGATGIGNRFAMDPAQLQIAAVRAAQHRGLIRDDIDPVAVGRQAYLSYNGALFAWARDLLTNDGLRLAVLHGLWSVLAAVASDTHRAEFLEHLRDLGPRLTAAGWGSGTVRPAGG